MTLLSRAIRFVVSLAGVALVTWAGSSLIPVNATTIGFAYLLLVLVIATIWGFLEALAASIGGGNTRYCRAGFEDAMPTLRRDFFVM